MKKVTLIFVVDDSIADEVQNDLSWGDMGNAADFLNKHCEESDYNVERYHQSKVDKLVEMYESLYDAEKDEFLRETGNN